jgi:deoxyribodipyrimidine photo-lyase
MPAATNIDPGFFEPGRAAALARLQAVRPNDYARSRNALDGAVTRLSPYLAHGVLTLPEAHAAISARHRLDPQHKLVYEFGWREFFHHVWMHRGNAIFQSLHAGPLPELEYASVLPDDIREGRTGVPVIDRAVRELYASGYLHNHARMWLASYVVHVRKVHWRAGADWLYGHLLDGDLASNHLSWQWVAGTASHKPYLFNAENVARFAPPAWHSGGTVIDCSYEALDQLARSRAVRDTEPERSHSLTAGIDEPAVFCTAPGPLGIAAADAAAVAGRDVWLVHPWALRERPLDLPPDALSVAVAIADWHDARPWSAARWHFVGVQQRALSSLAWHDSVAAMRAALSAARSVHTVDEPHLAGALARLHPDIKLRPLPRLFAPVDTVCASFSQWWQRTRLA